MNKFFQKILLLIILIGLILPTSTFIAVPKVQAAAEIIVGQVFSKVAPQPVTDPLHTKATIGGWIKESANWAWNQRDVVSKWALKTAGQVLKKVLLDRLVDATVAWINRGGKGAVIEDWDALLNKAGNDAVGIFAQKLGAGFLCSPFSVHLQLALLPVEPFSQITCSLDDIIRNVKAFENDFRNGSWLAYQATWVPKNNFYGATLIALNDQAEARTRSEQAAKDEAVAGLGFTSFTKKEYVEDPKGPYADKNGNTVAAVLAKIQKTNPEHKEYLGPRYSLKETVITPGRFVGDALTQSQIAAPFNAVIGADDTAKYIAAIVNAAVNKLTVIRVEGLKGALKKKTADFTTTTDQSPCEGLTGEAFRACLGYDLIRNSAYKSDRAVMLGQVNDTLKPRQEAAATLSQSIDRQSQLVAALTSLSACRPSDNAVTLQLNEEQATLDDLKNKLETNRTFLGPLEQAANSINNATSTNWTALTIQSDNVQTLLDPGTAQDLLDSAKTDAEEINSNVSTKLPTVQSQLTGCPQP